MAFDAFLKIAGVPGESIDDKHKDWIEVLSYHWGVEQPYSTSSTSGSLTAERANFGDFAVNKLLDKASPKLALGCASGEHFKDVTLELCRAGGDKQKYMEYKLTDVIIRNVNTSAQVNQETLPSEDVSFAYGKIEWKYTQTDKSSGKAKGDVAAGWDLEKNKKV